MISLKKASIGIFSCLCISVSAFAAKTTQEFFDFSKQNAPIDTLMYIQSSFSKNNLDQTIENLNDERVFHNEQLSELTKFYRSILLDMKNYISNDQLNQLIQDYGFTQTIDYAVYFEGPAPVLHISLNDANKFSNKVQENLKKNEITFTNRKIKGRDFLVSDILLKNVDVMNVIYIQESVATFAVIPKNYSDEQILNVMGVIKGEHSLYTQQTITVMENKYGYKDVSSGFFNIKQIAQTLFGKNESISSEFLFGIDKKIDSQLSQDCKNEILTLIDTTPIFMFGYKQNSLSATNMSFDVSGLFEINESSLRNELSSLSGHLMPINPDAAFSLSVGLNINNLISTATAWQQRAKNTKYKCNALANIMTVLADESYLQFVALLSTVQSIKGLHVSFYDLDLSEFLIGKMKTDMLVSVTSEYPQLLLLLSKTVPFLSNIKIPMDGSSTIVPTSINFDPPLKASMQGKHIFVYSGDQSEQYVSQLANVKINKQGITNASVDYVKFTDVYLNNLQYIAQSSNKSQSKCIDEYKNFLDFKNLEAKMGFEFKADNQGVFSDLNMSTNNEIVFDSIKTGKLDVMHLNTACQWEILGKETFNKDNTGGYQVKDSNNQCDLSVVEYSWSINENAIDIVEHKSQSREHCQQELQASENNQYSCLLLESTQDGFICYVQKDGIVDLYRYQ
ncbi:hypothetical protein [Marinicellulosiphila megalodicopiae]|uniref:hypothetical protein n=1 Tax=Marinicellulosiphila megalodicopiae TaxID=2724896 RepID=UPI003BAFF2C1